MPEQERSSNYYQLLGLSPSASPQQIRRAYREKSKLYHPDTTELPEAIATSKFQELNEAYGMLSSPERRVAYDLKMGYSRIPVIQTPRDVSRPTSDSRVSRSAYLDPIDRALSPGEIFALFILGITFAVCLLLVVAVGLTRGDSAVQVMNPLYSTPATVDQAEMLTEPHTPTTDSSPPMSTPDQPGVQTSETPDPVLAPEISPVPFSDFTPDVEALLRRATEPPTPNTAAPA